MPTEADADAEADADTEAEEDVCVAARPLNHAHFSPPSVEMVLEYCTAKGYTTIDPERFVSYYAARGWAVNGTNIVDWRATVDIWNRKDIENSGQAESKHNWTVGTVV